MSVNRVFEFRIVCHKTKLAHPVEFYFNSRVISISISKQKHVEFKPVLAVSYAVFFGMEGSLICSNKFPIKTIENKKLKLLDFQIRASHES